MTSGYIKSALALLILVGVTGSGKSLFRRLVLGEKVIQFSPSTPLAEAAVRSMCMCQVAVQRGFKWDIVEPQTMMNMVGEIIKKVEVLKTSWNEELMRQILTILPSNSIDSKKPLLEKPVELPQSDTTRKEPELKTVPLTSPKEQGPKPIIVAQPQECPTCDTHLTSCGGVLKGINMDVELIQKMNKPSANNDNKLLLEVDFIYLLDSGGQPPFREMLPHFVQHASAIVLMQKLNERLDFKPIIRYREKGGKVDKGYTSQLTNEQILYQYVQAVQSQKSKVFIVGTHIDREGECENETREVKNKELLKAFRPVLGEQLELYRGGKTSQLMFPVDNTSRKPDVEAVAEEFRKRVIEECMGEKAKIPLPWFILDQLLQLLAQKMGVKVLSTEECFLAAKQKLRMSNNVCKAALKFLGNLNIVFYRPNILEGVVFPDAQVILDKITELVRCCHALRTGNTDDESIVPSCMHTSEGLKFQEFGQISCKFLQKAFPSHYREDLFTATDFLKLLEDLLIASNHKNGKYFIPSLLPDLLLPDLPVEKLADYRVTSPEHPAPLIIYYPEKWVLVGVMPSLVVSLQNKCQWTPMEEDGEPTCLYHNCIQFKLPGGKPGNVVLIDSTKFLEIHVRLTLKVDPPLLRRMRHNIMTGLKKAHKSLHYDSAEAEEGFLCSGECGKNTQSHLATLNRKKDAWTCSERGNTGGYLNQQQSVWFETQLKDTAISECYCPILCHSNECLFLCSP